MEKKAIEKQIAEIEKRLKEGSLDKENREIWIGLEYLYSLLNPERYSEQQLEDLRRLKLELNFDENIALDAWLKERMP